MLVQGNLCIAIGCSLRKRGMSVLVQEWSLFWYRAMQWHRGVPLLLQGNVCIYVPILAALLVQGKVYCYSGPYHWTALF